MIQLKVKPLLLLITKTINFKLNEIILPLPYFSFPSGEFMWPFYKIHPPTLLKNTVGPCIFSNDGFHLNCGVLVGANVSVSIK